MSTSGSASGRVPRERSDRRLAAFPDQQHLATAVERRGRLGFDLCERLAWAALHARHASHRVACRKRIAEPGGDQQIADADVRAVRQERQFHPRDVAHAERDGAQPVAIDLDRRGMARITDQVASGWHLADDSVRVEQGLA
jgi:hypothetical protein